MNNYFNQMAKASPEEQVAILIDLLLDSLHKDSSEFKAYISSIDIYFTSNELKIKLEILGK